jgi:FKBP-type peptidyl-prolyl cis-trans isomerase
MLRTARRVAISLAFTLSLAAAGCDDSPTAPSHWAPFSQVDVRVGTGSEAIAGSTVLVNYTVWLYDETTADHKGLIVDTSAGRNTFQFTLGAGQVIAGWDRGVVGMKVGGLRRLVIPPSLGYGGVRVSSIPPYATLLFEVDLLEVAEAGSV